MQKISSLLLALIACAGTMFANGTKIGDLYYNLYAYNLTAEVTYEERSSTNYSYLSAVNIPESVEYNSVTYSVTSIGSEAFRYCDGLTSITIPNSVTSIGSEAFRYCDGLTSITIPNSVTSIGLGAFAYCSGLTSIVVASGNTNYDSRDNCNAIIETSSNMLIAGCQNTIIPNSVTSIGTYAFAGCSGLTSITIPNSVTSIGNYAFELVPNIVYSGSATGSPWGARSVNGYVDGFLVYSDNTKTNLLACSSQATGTIEIPNSVTGIGEGAFAWCTGLTSITIPNSVTSIGEGAFYYCKGLTSITIPNRVTSIGQLAFAECSGLTSITIPNSVTSIGYHTFYLCTGLTCITIPNSVTRIGNYAFYGCTGLTCITIPNSVTSIGNYAFENCSGLTSITIPNSVTRIGSEAFAYCSGLTSIIIPNSVTSIGELAFYGCTGLTSITIPNSVTSIGEGAFYECSALASVTNYAITPQTINSNVFYNVNLSSCTLYVPEGSINLYKAAYVWKDFTNIQAITGETSIGEVTNNQLPITNKVIKDGQVVILRGDKTYTVTGQQLK